MSYKKDKPKICSARLLENYDFHVSLRYTKILFSQFTSTLPAFLATQRAAFYQYSNLIFKLSSESIERPIKI